jgi:hypothetical protein
VADLDLDDDEKTALDGILRFIRECLDDPEVVAALTLAECARDAREFAAEVQARNADPR